MDSQFRDRFATQWRKYFGEVELPIAYYYTDQVPDNDRAGSQVTHRCLIGNLGRVREGHPFVYEAHTGGCSGGKRYTGFSRSLRPKFEYFLSCGIPGELEGERYKQSPQLVQAYLESHPPFTAPGKYLVFKRWDQLDDGDAPLAVIFFARPDVLSGLFALANYDSADPQAVITPMGSGCASIIGYPYQESKSKHPRCVLGLFDVSARPCVPEDRLTFTIPMSRFEQLVGYMEESFLVTGSWKVVKDRILANAWGTTTLPNDHPRK